MMMMTSFDFGTYEFSLVLVRTKRPDFDATRPDLLDFAIFAHIQFTSFEHPVYIQFDFHHVFVV